MILKIYVDSMFRCLLDKLNCGTRCITTFLETDKKGMTFPHPIIQIYEPYVVLPITLRTGQSYPCQILSEEEYQRINKFVEYTAD